MKMKIHHPLQVFCRRDKTHSYDINGYFLIKEVGRKQRHLDSVLNCVRGSEVCSVPEKNHSKKMHALGDF
jgi:hypothetical protein